MTNLRVRPNWAAHILASAEGNLAAARECIPDSEIINSVLRAYDDGDWLTESYCDHILSQFDSQIVEEVYASLPGKTENVVRCAERFFNL